MTRQGQLNTYTYVLRQRSGARPRSYVGKALYRPISTLSVHRTQEQQQEQAFSRFAEEQDDVDREGSESF